MNQGGFNDNSYRINTGKLRMVVTSELLRAIRDMHQIDELFQWLALNTIQYFGVSLVQIWVAQPGYQGLSHMKLLTQSSKDNSLRNSIILNKSVADLAQDMLSRQSELAPGPVRGIFSDYQATLYHRYGLYYCFGEYLNPKGQSPSFNGSVPGGRKITPMEAAALLFFSQPPHPELQKSIGYILKLAMQLAGTNAQFQSPVVSQSNTPDYNLQLQQANLSLLSKLVPRRKEDIDLMTTNSPLGGQTVIPDKLARLVYREIDGRKNVQELRSITRLGMKEVARALRTLLDERRVDLFDVFGRPVDAESLLNDL